MIIYAVYQIGHNGKRVEHPDAFFSNEEAAKNYVLYLMDMYVRSEFRAKIYKVKVYDKWEY